MSKECPYPVCYRYIVPGGACVLSNYLKHPITDQEMLEAHDTFSDCPDHAELSRQYETKINDALKRVYPDYDFD